jgi:hypothetical protein
VNRIVRACRSPAGRVVFEVAHLYAKSGSLTPPKRFVFELRDIVLL